MEYVVSAAAIVAQRVKQVLVIANMATTFNRRIVFFLLARATEPLLWPKPGLVQYVCRCGLSVFVQIPFATVIPDGIA